MGDREALSYRSRSNLDWFLQTPVYKEEGDPFLYRSWSRINPIIRTERDVTINNAAYGSEFYVEINKEKTRVGPMWLLVTRSALTVGGGTFARFSQFEGYNMFERIKFIHSEFLLADITDFHMFLRHRRLPLEIQQWWGDHFVYGDLPAATRTTLASAARTLYVPLFNPTDRDMRLYMGLQSLGEKVRLNFTTKGLDKITQTDHTSTPTGSITSMKLRTFNYHMTTEAKSKHNRMGFGKGKKFRIQEWSQVHVQTFATGIEGTEVELTLSGLNGPAGEVSFYIYDTANRDYTAANATNERFTFVQLTSIEGFINSTRVIPLHTYTWNVNQHQVQYYDEARPGDNEFRYSFSENINDPLAILGHQGFNTNDPLVVKFTWPATPAISTAHELHAHILKENFLNHRNGKIKRIAHS